MIHLQTKEDLFNFFLKINEPLRQHYVGKSRIMFGSTGVGYGNEIAGVEGFARMMWGAGPAYPSLPNAFKSEIKAAFIAGTRPNNVDYWGDLYDRDQRMVEMPALALALIHNDCALWKEFTKNDQIQIVQWFEQIFKHDCADGNWQFFKVIIYVVLKHLGVAGDLVDFKKAKRMIDNCYQEDGWYQDSSRGRNDYYTAFAFHYYGIIYSKLAPDDPWSAVLKKRAKLFSKQFILFFDRNGSNVAFGRSMTYRWAAVAFWVVMVYGSISPEYNSTFKGIINRNIRYFMEHKIFDEMGLLTLGYDYGQLSMTEPYNSPVSPYWSNKIFLLLTLDYKHDYWNLPESDFPEIDTVKLLKSPHMLANMDNGHAVLLNAGQPGPNYHALTNEKYFKLAYSSKFGFSIPRGNQLKEEQVMDSSIGIQRRDTQIMVSRKQQNFLEPGGFYTRNNVSDVVVNQDFVASTWRLNNTTTIRTWLTWFNDWQIRIHHLILKENCEVYETGFAVPNSPDTKGQFTDNKRESYFKGELGFTGVVDLTPKYNNQRPSSINGFPNTNLITSEIVALPGRITSLDAGNHWIVTGVYAHDDVTYATRKWKQKPVVQMKEGNFFIFLNKNQSKIINLIGDEKNECK